VLYGARAFHLGSGSSIGFRRKGSALDPSRS
jgi:hypothetical protein